jgi:hypothetical protein
LRTDQSRSETTSNTGRNLAYAKMGKVFAEQMEEHFEANNRVNFPISDSKSDFDQNFHPRFVLTLILYIYLYFASQYTKWPRSKQYKLAYEINYASFSMSDKFLA